nr:tetratricopeptide repeat protein [Deltaproteobacteria bacterium]
DKRATELKARRDELLSSLAEKANSDPALALALGVAYLQSGDGEKAEPLLRKAAEARPNEPEPTFQLAKALAKQGKLDDAIVQLKKAREIGGARIDIGFELARTYELANRDSLASELYTTLLATPDLGVEYRGHACRFFGRTGAVEKAAAEGDAIFKLDPKNPAGLYCRGEGLLLRKKADVARSQFLQAVAADPNAQYLDAQGRAAELLVEQSGDTKFFEEAIRVYQLAHTSAPTMINPLIGQGRVYVARKEWSKAIEVLGKADALKHDDAEIALLMGLAAEALNQKPDAIIWLGRANALKPRADTAWRLGNLYFDTNDTGRAKPTLYQAISLGLAEEKAVGTPLPWITDAYYEVGYIEDLLGNAGAARDAWTTYVHRQPKAGPQLKSVQQALYTRLK